MSAVLTLGAAAVQGLLMPLLALVLAGLEGWFRARLVGGPGAPVLRPWRMMRSAFRRQILRAEAGSILAAAGPVLTLAITWTAAVLVPVAGAGGDVMAVAGLLVAARLIGLGADDKVALVAEPVLLIAIMVRGLPGAGAAAPIGLAAMAIAVLALAGREANAAEASGRDLAVLRMAAALRRLVLLVLLAGQMVPETARGIEGICAEVGATVAIVAALAGGVAVAEAAVAPLRPERRREVLLGCVVLAVLGVLVGLLEAGS